jgi:hypothetical protein
MTTPKNKGRGGNRGLSIPISSVHFTEKIRRGLGGMIDIPLDGRSRCFVCGSPQAYCEYFQPPVASAFRFRFRVCQPCWTPEGVSNAKIQEIQGHIMDAGKAIATSFIVAIAEARRAKRRLRRQARRRS